MRVEIGNDNAIEEYREPGSDELRVRALEGERVTTLLFPEDYSLGDAVTSTVDALRHHMRADTKPAWIESDVEPLRQMLCEHYAVDPSKTRPLTWGGEVDAPEPDPEPEPAPEAAETTEDDD